MVARSLKLLVHLPDVIVTLLMLAAMLVMLAGVFLRYVVTQVSLTFDLPSVRFFWVEELGEFLLIWLTFIGAAIGIARGQHFAVHLLTGRFSPRVQQWMVAVEFALAALFGAVLAYYAPHVAARSAQALTPSLKINMAYLYYSAFVGGVLLVIYSLASLVKTLRDSPRPTSATEAQLPPEVALEARAALDV